MKLEHFYPVIKDTVDADHLGLLPDNGDLIIFHRRSDKYFENLIPIVIYPKKGYRAKAGDEKRKLFSFLKDNNFKDIQD